MSGYSDMRRNVFWKIHHRNMQSPFATGYRQIRDQVSICTSVTSLYLGIIVRITASDTSGGRFAIRTLLIPRPVVYTRTIDISPWVCRYSTCFPIKWSTFRNRLLSRNFIYTCLLGRRFAPLGPHYLLASIVHKSIPRCHMPICVVF